ncbi:MAG: dienelactone hydrolase family protein [Phycisphaeraceae bacterium]|nr:dienelactone hydrolase family protein [Phycisphaeraceae bacterium]
MKRTYFPSIPPPPPAVRLSVSDVLGYKAPRVPLRLERLERKVFKDYVREKVAYDVERGLSVTAWVCMPRNKARKSELPGVLCCHGDGPGKDPLVGLLNGEPCLEYHKLVAVRLAQHGYVTITPDRRGYGDRSPVPYSTSSDRYRANLAAYYQRDRQVSLLALDIADAARAIDVLTQYADADRLGCMGVYDGATVAAGVAVKDERIKTACLACFIGDAEYCRRIAPKPVQVQIPHAAPQQPRDCRGKHIQRHAFDGVIELDFPALAAWMDGHLS